MSIDVNRDFIFEQSKYFYCQLTQFLLTIHKKNLHNVSSHRRGNSSATDCSLVVTPVTPPIVLHIFGNTKINISYLKKNLILFLIFDNKIDGDWFLI